jgi:hypothetical protein
MKSAMPCAIFSCNSVRQKGKRNHAPVLARDWWLFYWAFGPHLLMEIVPANAGWWCIKLLGCREIATRAPFPHFIPDSSISQIL